MFTRPRLLIITSSCCLALTPSILLPTEPARSETDAISFIVNYCSNFRRVSPHDETIIRLSDDNMTLCFDGTIKVSEDMELFHKLKDNGLVFVRSSGGYARPAAKISNILRDK